LYNTADFPTGVDNKSATATDGIFIDKCKISNYSITAIVNGLSDHDVQLLLLKILPLKFQRVSATLNARSIE
jgi:hypothetical protein